MSRVKILLVDDRKENLLALEALLRSNEVEIFKAFSGREALELILKHHFAVALVDVQMPEINGFELAELIRGSQSAKEIPIIFVTAGAIDATHTFKGYEAGAVDFLYKPLDPRIVKTKIQTFLRLEEQRMQIEAQLQQLQVALKTREEFLTIASHELKTPITSLSLQFQLARRLVDVEKKIVPAPEKLVKVFDLANRQIAKLSGLIEELLDISRIQEGRLTIVKVDADLSELVKEVAEGMQDQLQQAHCSLTLELEPEVHAPCEPFRIEQVVVNLLSNVIKYAPGSPVTVKLSREGSQVKLVVKDQGPGIPAGKLDVIFERFERIANSDQVSGLGLGLYIVKQIMLAHGGEIVAESLPGRGSRFVATLPLD